MSAATNGLEEFAVRVGRSSPPSRGGQSPQPDMGALASSYTGAKCWAQVGDGFFPVGEATPKLAAGAYRCMYSDRGPYLSAMKLEVDALLALPDNAAETLVAEFSRFWKLRASFEDRGFTWKRGLLMWGPPGSGKTSAIWQMVSHLITDLDGIVIFVEDPGLATACIQMVRRIEPARPLVTVMEDIDALTLRHGEHGYLALLDGESQVSNVVHVATTNYPERLDKRFVDRPSRFDTIMLVEMPGPDARRFYLSKKEPSLDEVTLERWVRRSDGFSVAHLRELIVAIRCFEQPEDEVFKRLEVMRGGGLSSDGSGGLAQERVGFGRVG